MFIPDDPLATIIGVHGRRAIERQAYKSEAITVIFYRGEHPCYRYLIPLISASNGRETTTLMFAGESMSLDIGKRYGIDYIVAWGGNLVEASIDWRVVLRALAEELGEIDYIVATPGYWYPVQWLLDELGLPCKPLTYMAKQLVECRETSKPEIILLEDPLDALMYIARGNVLVVSHTLGSRRLAKALASRRCRVRYTPSWFGHLDAQTLVDYANKYGTRKIVLAGKPPRKSLDLLTGSLPPGSVVIVRSGERKAI